MTDLSKLSDRELLELAAEAVGNVRFDPFGEVFRVVGRMGFLCEEWSALADPGDALRLAVSLCLEITYAGGSAVVRAHDCSVSRVCAVPGRDGPDMVTALCRAITFAAAAVALAKRGA